MRQFMTILFGGLAVVLGGWAAAWAIGAAWRAAAPYAPDLGASFAAVVDALTPGAVSGTTVSGLSRKVRYTAGEEEDVINMLVSRIPDGARGPITAPAYLLEDMTSKRVIDERESERLLPIASLTKLVTAVIAEKTVPPDLRISLTPEIMQTYGNTAGFREGETFTAKDLFYPLLMVSSNDAAEALARAYGRARFIEAMNGFAQSIGAYRTYFADPSGLSDKNESTAADMAIIIDWIRVHDPDILSVTKLKTKTVRGHTWENPAHFLSWSYYDGGKNGYTGAAQRTTAALFTIGPDKHVYALVLLGSMNRDTDSIRLLGKIESANHTR